MTTAEKLEAITDRGKFEKLATSVLRNVKEDYEAILHLGVNAAGEPVKSPLDGFCIVSGSTPPRFIMVQHTTTEEGRRLPLSCGESSLLDSIYRPLKSRAFGWQQFAEK